MRGLRANGLNARPSSTNFIFVDLGKRSARHVMNRADMLAIEVLLCLCEGFRQKVLEMVCPSRAA